jgi:hypothetical protein
VSDSGWVSIAERLPGDGETVLAYEPDRRWGQVYQATFWKDFQAGDGDSRFDPRGDGARFLHDDKITHWMPLPKPPRTRRRQLDPIGLKLRQARENTGITLVDIAKIFDISIPAASDYERGIGQRPSAEMLKTWLRYVGKPGLFDEIMGMIEAEKGGKP